MKKRCEQSNAKITSLPLSSDRVKQSSHQQQLRTDATLTENVPKKADKIKKIKHIKQIFICKKCGLKLSYYLKNTYLHVITYHFN